MQELSRVIVTLITVFSILAAAAPVPASCKVCPCCATAGSNDCGSTSIHEPMGCCSLKGAAPSESVTLNTGVEEFSNFLTVRSDETAPSFTTYRREVPRPDYGLWAFESPPPFLLNATFIC